MKVTLKHFDYNCLGIDASLKLTHLIAEAFFHAYKIIMTYLMEKIGFRTFIYSTNIYWALKVARHWFGKGGKNMIKNEIISVCSGAEYSNLPRDICAIFNFALWPKSSCYWIISLLNCYPVSGWIKPM